MDEVAVQALDPRLGRWVIKARTALAQGDAAYAVEVLREVITQEPGCADARKLWWRALRIQSPHGGGWVAKLKRRFSSGKPVVVGDDPTTVIVEADRALAKDPGDVRALRCLAAAAKALRWAETECFALEAWVSLQRGDKTASLAWVESLQRHGRFDDALRAVEALLEKYPNDGDAQSAKRDLGVARTMREGGWENEHGSFRDRLRE